MHNLHGALNFEECRQRLSYLRLCISLVETSNSIPQGDDQCRVAIRVFHFFKVGG